MRFEELNWMDVEAYLKKDDRLMLVLGACEQHGYLSLLSDAKIPQALADAASQQSGVLAGPALNFGISPYFTTYPGTISLKVHTYLLVVEDIVRSVHAQGFRRLLILNGHGGNTPVTARLSELCNELPDLRIEWYAWWTAASVTAVAEKHGLKSYHAAWIEAFPFTRVAKLPDGVKEPRTARPAMSAARTRELFGDGVFGGPYQVPDGVMDEIFAAALQDIVQMLQFPE
jgi:creatinine amidohydrolase